MDKKGKHMQHLPHSQTSRRYPGAMAACLSMLLCIAYSDALAPGRDEPAKPAETQASVDRHHWLEPSAQRPDTCRRRSRVFKASRTRLATWSDARAAASMLRELPADAVILHEDGVYAHDGNLYVRMQMDDGTHIAKVALEGGVYRVVLDGQPGPVIHRVRGTEWDLALIADNEVAGSALAHLQGDVITADGAIFHRAAQIMETFGVSERTLLDRMGGDNRAAFNAITLSSVGAAFADDISTKLQDMDRPWTLYESALILPDLARHLARPLVLTSGDKVVMATTHEGTVTWAFDRVWEPAPVIQMNEIVVRELQGRYLIDSAHPDDLPQEFPTIFAAVEAASRPAGTKLSKPPKEWEQRLRTHLAEDIGKSHRGHLLERALQSWFGQQLATNRDIRAAADLARLHLALFDAHLPLSRSHETLILKFVQDLVLDKRLSFEVREHGTNRLLTRVDAPLEQDLVVIEADLDSQGHGIRYYMRAAQGMDATLARPPTGNAVSPIIDAVLNSQGGKVRRALKFGEWEWERLAREIESRASRVQNPLLPPALTHLVRTDPALLAQAATVTADHWETNGRRYVRLRHMDGRSQIVETTLTPRHDGRHEILGNDGSNTGIDIRQEGGRWFLPASVQEGYQIAPQTRRRAETALREGIARAAGAAIPAVVDRLLDSLPFPFVIEVSKTLQGVTFTQDGSMQLTTTSRTYDTRLGKFGEPIGSSPPSFTTDRWQPGSDAAGTRLVFERVNAFKPLDRANARPGSVEAIGRLLAMGSPVSAFIRENVGTRHVQALATARRLRYFLLEARRMAVVGQQSSHVFVLVMPNDTRALGMFDKPAARPYIPLADLPAGTYIVDDVFGISTDAASYPTRLRAVASQWASEGRKLSGYGPDGSVVAESPIAVAERILSEPVQVSTWNPEHDPIREIDYVEHLRERQKAPAHPGHAGLDWLPNTEARLDYQHYFARASMKDPAPHPSPILVELLNAPVRAFDH